MVETREAKKAAPNQLQIWDKLQLEFDDGKQQGRYLARVEDITSGQLVIDRPTWLSGEPMFKNGATFIATFIRTDAAYSFNSVVIGPTDEKSNSYRVRVPNKIERNQRRRYFRIDVDYKVTLIPADDLLSGRQTDQELVEFSGQSVNISGNGLLVRTLMECDDRAYLLVTVDLNQQKIEVVTVGKVRRYFTDDEGNRYYGIELFTFEEMHSLLKRDELRHVPQRFKQFKEKDRTGLLNHIFAEQVALRQKGML